MEKLDEFVKEASAGEKSPLFDKEENVEESEVRRSQPEVFLAMLPQE